MDERSPRTRADPPGAAALIAGSARLVLANSGLRRIASVWGLWVGGEWAVLVALSVAAFDRGGTSAVAVVAALRMLPAAVAGPMMSGLVDRLPRGRVLFGALLSWVVLVAAMSLALRAESLAPLYLMVAAASVSATVLRPAIKGLIPQVVDRPDELTAANSTFSVVEAGGSLLGPLLIGLLLALVSQEQTFLVIAGLLALTAALSLRIRTDFQPPDHHPAVGWRAFLAPLAGFPALCSTAPLRGVFAVLAAQTLTRGLLNVFVVSIAVSLLGQSVASTSVLFSALGAGGLLGALLTLAGVRWRAARPFAIGMVFWGLPLLLIAAAPHAAVVWLAIAIIGIGNAVGDVFGFTLLHRLIPDHLLGRAFGALWGTIAAMQALGAALATPLIAHLQLRGALVASGALMVVVPVICWPALRNVDTHLSVDDERVAILQRCAVLGRLTRLALEQLARRATPMSVPAGTTVIEQGQSEDTFYVIVDGELTASVNGTQVSRMSGGDCFGEIAALHRTPRTATVVADSECNLLRLDGSTFVLAVTGYRPARAAAVQLSEQRRANDPS